MSNTDKPAAADLNRGLADGREPHAETAVVYWIIYERRTRELAETTLGASPDRHPATCIVSKRTKTPNGEIRLHIALADPFPRTQSSESVVLRTIFIRKVVDICRKTCQFLYKNLRMFTRKFDIFYKKIWQVLQ